MPEPQFIPNPRQQELLERFSRAIYDERVRAHRKHGKTSMEQAHVLAHRRASILTEEAVECAKALNDHEHGDITLQPDAAMVGNDVAHADQLDGELIQVGAMAYTWWANRRGDQLNPALGGRVVGLNRGAVVVGTATESVKAGEKVTVRLNEAGLAYILGDIPEAVGYDVTPE